MKALPQQDLDEIADRCADVFKALDGAHVLITGHTGFIGSWLFVSLARAIDAWNLDVRLTGLSRSRYDFTMSPRRVPPGDACGFTGPNGGDIRRLSMHPQTTHVIHCASAGSAGENRADPEGVSHMIVAGTKRVIAECERVGVSRLLHLSSGSVYDDGNRPTENDPVKDPTNPDRFALAKIDAEIAVVCSPVPSVTARGFAMLGPRLPSQFAASQFMADALAGRPIRVTNPGTVRSYLYASDMAAWLWTLLVRGEAGTAYNVGGHGGFPVGWLAECLEHRKLAVIDRGDGEAAAPFVGDTSRAQSLGLGALVGPSEAMARWWAWERGA